MIFLIILSLDLCQSESLSGSIEKQDLSSVKGMLAVPNYRQEIYDFSSGFLNGIQSNPKSPSNCVVSLITLKQTWSAFFNGLTYLNFEAFVLALFNFNSFISKLQSTYTLCSLSQLHSIIFPPSIPAGLNLIFKRWLLNKTAVGETIQVIQKNFNQSDYVTAGYNSAKLFTLLTGYIIK